MIKHIYIFVLAMMLLASSDVAKAQDVALKTNLLGCNYSANAIA